MLFEAILLCCIFVNGFSERRIYGGRPALARDYDFVLRVEHFSAKIQEQLHCCTGNLLTHKWLLTAAHCRVCRQHGLVRIRYGDVNAPWSANNTYSKVLRWLPHPGYRADFYVLNKGEKLTTELMRHFVYQNDIALLLVEHIPVDTFAELHPADYTNSIGEEVVALGYGLMNIAGMFDNTLALSQPLQRANLSVKPCDKDLVVNSYPILCVTHKRDRGDFGESAMPGDSGGPLVLEGRVLGVCSYGFHALHGKHMILRESGFYTAVGPYFDWIENVTGESLY